MTAPLGMEVSLWRELIMELKKRGRNTRESGAFLLGPAEDNVINRFICYDELDPHALQNGIINFSGNGFIPLWKICQEQQLKVKADVHTHPDSWTGQSGTDKDNPMILQAGYIALIVPHYAGVKRQLLNGVGAYEYLGSRRWHAFPAAENIIHLKTKKNGFYRKYIQPIIARFNRKKRL